MRPILLVALVLATMPASPAAAAPVGDDVFALWESIGDHFAPAEQIVVPPNPTYTTQDRKTMIYRTGGVYAGADTELPTGSATAWQRVQTDVLDAAGVYRRLRDGAEAPPHPLAKLWLNDAHYHGLALFGGAERFSSLELGDPVRGGELESSAIFGVTVDDLWLDKLRIGGLNMRGTRAKSLIAHRTLFRAVDLTGAHLGERAGFVKESVFDRVSGNRFAQGPDGTADPFNQPMRIERILFSHTAFRDSDFSSARFDSVAFTGCGFLGVDFRGAQITGTDPGKLDGRFQQTFASSVLERVSFKDAVLENVSFRGADLSGGGVSFDGATLRNVDFTDAEGLQHIDWTKVHVAGRVYGLARFGHLLKPTDKTHLRGATLDHGAIPGIDRETGYDKDPVKGHLIHPASGVRLIWDAAHRLVPIDVSGARLLNPDTRGELAWISSIGVYDPRTGERFKIEYSRRRGRG